MKELLGSKSERGMQNAERRTGWHSSTCNPGFAVSVASLWLMLFAFSLHGYTLKSAVLDAGGAGLSSTSYRMNLSLSQPFASGWLAGTNYRGIIGFWHGPWVSGGVAQAGAPMPVAYSVSGSSPNPCNRETRIRYTLPVTAQVSLKVCDNSGRVLGVLAEGKHAPGYYTASWGFSNTRLANGIYFLRFEAEGFVAIRPVVVLR